MDGSERKGRGWPVAGTVEAIGRAGSAAGRSLPGGASARAELPDRPRRTGLAESFRSALDHRRLFVLLPFAMIGGLIVATMVTPPDLIWLGAVGLGLVLGAGLSWRRLVALRIFALLAAGWIGFSLLPFHGALSGTELLYRPAYGHYTATVDSVISELDGTTRIIVSQITPQDGARGLPIRRARLAIDDAPHLSSGDVISGPIRFYPVPGPVVPGGYDGQFHGYFQGIGAYGTATGEITVRGGETDPGTTLIESIRRTIGARIDAVLDQPAAGIARALITGDQTTVSEEARDIMATAGLAHVLSISGLHLTMVAGSVFILARLGLAAAPALSRRLPVKRVAAVVAILAAVGYFSICHL